MGLLSVEKLFAQDHSAKQVGTPEFNPCFMLATSQPVGFSACIILCESEDLSQLTILVNYSPGNDSTWMDFINENLGMLG